ncbi:uncharacterized protein LOC143570123 isoform X2 [Bidens hawaiensis]|uniref:uncharacterized protein LOC143570123 isoform X2 n=1 Tax=Bidens hawaiensis TaxID=980011 RepID=UPI00404932AF
MNYAVSHNVQQLNVVCFPEKDFEFPLSLVSSQSIKHLSLKACFSSESNRRSHFRNYSFSPASTLELPALTTLDLHSVILCNDEADKCVGIISKCANLKNLTLRNFKTMGSNGCCIFHPRLSNLKLEHGWYGVKVVNVVAPRLENLTINGCSAEYVISAPHLASLLFKGSHPLPRPIDGFHSLEKADICVPCIFNADAHKIVCLLQQLHNVQLLALNMEIVELLSSSVQLLLHQPSPFVNLKSLKIYPGGMYMWGQAPKALSSELKSYLLDGSPGSTFTIVLPEEIAVHKLMAELRVLLNKKKDNIKTTNAQPERGKAPAESHKPKKRKTLGDMERIMGYWENLEAQVKLRKTTVASLFRRCKTLKNYWQSCLHQIGLKIQPCFSSLCEEANIAISKLADCIKIQCDKNQSLPSVCFHKLATTLESSP